MVDDKCEGRAGSCRWTRSGEGLALGLDQGTRVARVTSHGGRHQGHALVRGRGGAGRVASMIEDWGDTCPRHGGCTCGVLLAVVWWLILKKLPSAMDGGFLTEFGHKTRRWRFQWKLEAAHGVSRRVR
jgi:hypothetical protein